MARKSNQSLAIWADESIFCDSPGTSFRVEFTPVFFEDEFLSFVSANGAGERITDENDWRVANRVIDHPLISLENAKRPCFGGTGVTNAENEFLAFDLAFIGERLRETSDPGLRNTRCRQHLNRSPGYARSRGRAPSFLDCRPSKLSKL